MGSLRKLGPGGKVFLLDFVFLPLDGPAFGVGGGENEEGMC